MQAVSNGGRQGCEGVGLIFAELEIIHCSDLAFELEEVSIFFGKRQVAV